MTISFERVYISNTKHDNDCTNSKATKACDVSRTTIYRANTPTNYACVNELEFQTQSIKQNSLKPSKTSPPLASIAKMGEKNEKVNIERVSPQRVHFLYI